LGSGFGLASGFGSGLGSGFGSGLGLVSAAGGVLATGLPESITVPSAVSVIMPPADEAAATRALLSVAAGALLVAGAVAGALGTGSGLTLLRSGISMGMSTDTGRGWVSNNSGNPITPTSTSTAAPSRRWRARRRMDSTLSAGTAAGALRPSLPCGPRVRNLKNAMKFDP
jgi:hypothetical protein